MTGHLLVGYYGLISLIAATVTVTDKVRAIRGKWRVPEATLLAVGAAGGAAAMFATMVLVRHKIRRAKFMVGLPLMALAHTALAVWMGKTWG